MSTLDDYFPQPAPGEVDPVRLVRAGDGERYGDAPWLFKATGQETRGRFDFMVGNVPLFSGPPLHVHTDQHDTFYVLDGILTLQVYDEIHELGPGDFVTVPPGVPHTFDNAHPDQLRVHAVNVMTPGGLNEYFARALAPDLEETERASLRKRFGTSVGPPLRVKLGLTTE